MNTAFKKVYLIGAGPGDKNLLTIKGKEILEKAEVVVYDRLVGAGIIDMIPKTAEKINVGKNVNNHPVPQEEINQILLEKARENKLVVRLKGGDSFLFGRGGEELELLSENGIPFEVIPGITSAIAAAAYAGIPVTHRDFCSSLHIITGHAKKNGEVNIDYEALVKLNGTLVFMMSVGSIVTIAQGLIQGGMDSDTAIAVVENGTRLNQRKFVGKLSDIGEIIKSNNVISPAAIIVGEVCTLSDKFDWFNKENLPLMGKKILATRPRETSTKMLDMLSQEGAQVTLYPCIKTKAIDFSIDVLGFDWAIFTSSFGVECFFEKLVAMGQDARCLYGKKIAVVGSQTGEALLKYGIKADFVPTVFDGLHLAKELTDGKLEKGERVTLYRAKMGGDDLVEILENHGVAVTDVPVYDTEYIQNDSIDICEYDVVTFTSASCVEGFVRSNKNGDFSGVNALCIGDQTAILAREAGMKVTISDTATIKSMVEKLIQLSSTN